MANKKENNKEVQTSYPYAVVQTSGQQFKVAQGDQILVDSISDLNPGAEYTCDQVLLVANAPGDLKVGQPCLSGAKVTFEVLQHTVGPKILIRHHRRRQNSQNSLGHRQPLTRLCVKSIQA